jgi:hypothetical protein
MRSAYIQVIVIVESAVAILHKHLHQDGLRVNGKLVWDQIPASTRRFPGLATVSSAMNEQDGNLLYLRLFVPFKLLVQPGSETACKVPA